MKLQYIQMYLAIKSYLENILPSNFFARLILANIAKHVGKHGYVVQLKSPTGKFLLNKYQLLQYCEANNINFMTFKHLKFRYYLKNHHFPSEANMEPKEKGKILFAYTKQIIADIKNDVFSFRCCSKQFCRKELFEQHRNVVHPFVIKKT